MTRSSTNPMAFVDGFDATRSGLPGADLSWLKNIREAGFEQFSALGLPTPKLEDWKYTRLSPLEDTVYKPITEEDGMAVLNRVPSLLPDCATAGLLHGSLVPEAWSISRCTPSSCSLPRADTGASSRGCRCWDCPCAA